MKHIGSFLPQATAGEALPAARLARVPDLPSPSSLAPADATAVGSRLLELGVPKRAWPYLLRGARARPSSFGWCRLGKLCRDEGFCDYATRCYDEALRLEPGNHYAIIGRAAALAESSESLTDLVHAFEQLARLTGKPSVKIAWTAYVVMRAISRITDHPAIHTHTRALRQCAEQLDQRSNDQRRAELDAHLDRIVHAQILPEDSAVPVSLASISPASPPEQIKGSPQHLLPAGRSDISGEAPAS